MILIMSIIIAVLVLIIWYMSYGFIFHKKVSQNGIYFVTVYDKAIDMVTVIPFTNKIDSLTAYQSFKSSEQTHEVVGYYKGCMLNEKYNLAMNDKVQMWITNGR